MKKDIVFLMVFFTLLLVESNGQISTPPDAGNVIKIDLPKTVTNTTTQVCNPSLTIAWIIISAIVLFFIFLVIYSNILRDDVDQVALVKANNSLPAAVPVAITDQAKIARPFSLSRVQLGIWTIVIASSYIYVFFNCCYQSIEFSSHILALMGISAGTAAIGNAIDKNQAASPTGAARHQNQPSKGILTDILSDENGISIHRFQNVVFTIVAIVVYIYKIHTTKCAGLPELDTTLVALMGISTATYLGLKINENKQ